MKTEKQIEEEIKKHKEHLENTTFSDRTTEQKIHSAIVEALEWVLKQKEARRWISLQNAIYGTL